MAHKEEMVVVVMVVDAFFYFFQEAVLNKQGQVASLLASNLWLEKNMFLYGIDNSLFISNLVTGYNPLTFKVIHYLKFILDVQCHRKAFIWIKQL